MNPVKSISSTVALQANYSIKKNWGQWIIEKIQKIWKAFIYFITCRCCSKKLSETRISSETKPSPTLIKKNETLLTKAPTSIQKLPSAPLKPAINLGFPPKTKPLVQEPPKAPDVPQVVEVPNEVVENEPMELEDFPSPDISLRPSQQIVLRKMKKNPDVSLPNKGRPLVAMAKDPLFKTLSFLPTKDAISLLTSSKDLYKKRDDFILCKENKKKEYFFTARQRSLLRKMKKNPDLSLPNKDRPIVTMAKEPLLRTLSFLKKKEALALLTSSRDLYKKRDEYFLRKENKTREYFYHDELEKLLKRYFSLSKKELAEALNKYGLKKQVERFFFLDDPSLDHMLLFLIENGCFPNVKELLIDTESSLTEEQICKVIEKLGSKLNKLTIRNIPLSAKIIQTIANHCPELTEISFIMKGLTEKDAFPLTKCKKLKFFNISESPFTPAGIIKFAAQLPCLDFLSFKSSAFTDEFLISLAEIKTLKNLNLIKIANITPDGLVTLQKNCKSLEEVYVNNERFKGYSKVNYHKLPESIRTKCKVFASSECYVLRFVPEVH